MCVSIDYNHEKTVIQKCVRTFQIITFNQVNNQQSISIQSILFMSIMYVFEQIYENQL
jgi:hypothetical protein